MALRGITVRTVQALQPGETVWDAGHREAVKGFGVRRQRESAVYVLKFRVFGRQRFVTIGHHGGHWTPDAARREAKRLLGRIADGRDPQAEKVEARDKAADTLGKVADAYLAYAKRKQKPRSYTETERHLSVNWKPLHPVSVFHLHRRQVAARLAEIEVARGRVTAARARAALSAMFNWAIREGFDIANPVFGTNRPAEPKSRERVLTDPELAEIWRACGDDDYGRIVRLLMLTGQRRDEIGAMRWAEIDHAKGLWTIPGARTKNHREHIVPLTAAALAVLPALPNVDREFVFGNGPRRNGDPPAGFSGWSKSKATLDRRIAASHTAANGPLMANASKAKALPGWRLHDLRRTAATVMSDRLGVLPHIVEAILNHVSGHRAGVAGVYNRARYEVPMREALAAWAAHASTVVADAHKHRLRQA